MSQSKDVLPLYKGELEEISLKKAASSKLSFVSDKTAFTG